MTQVQQQTAAKAFAAHWEGKGYEKGESQTFWLTLLNQVFGIEHPEMFITFEQQVHLDHTSFIDGFIPSTHVMIEQKSLGKDLGAPIKQSDGSLLTPFQQAKRYASELPYSQRPRWIVTCNFAEWWVYDTEQPNGEPQKILLKDLEKEFYRLQFLVDAGNEHLKREMEVSVRAGELVGVIYDKLLEQYMAVENSRQGAATPSDDILRSLNILCVRLVFCLYAEDAGLFNSRTSFHDFLAQYSPKDIRRALIDLFAVLDMPTGQRDPYLDNVLNSFPYVNGGLFSDTQVIIPQFTSELKDLLLQNASDGFDWSEISPTIFGAVFESTLNPETRRSGGMHYTSIENIHKVIDPLFLDDLKAEFDNIKSIKQNSPRQQALHDFQNKLASLTFFDPACGSGNFLTETFLSLRRLENKVIQAMFGGENVLTFDILIKVNISQFYGIEINDFACSVAKTALWIAESQTLKETSAIAGRAIDFLPLKTNAYIHEGNALRMDWADVIAPERLNYIMGNPPFVGNNNMSKEQREDILPFFPENKTMDYVCAWYVKSAEMMQANRYIRAALVSTNSICQGEMVPLLWTGLAQKYNVHIDFAVPTFRWDSESNLKAHVHCIIVGFSAVTKSEECRLYHVDGTYQKVENINGYLCAAPNIYVISRTHPLCNIPEIRKGNQPTEGGYLIFDEKEKADFINKEPSAAKYIKRLTGAKEFINNIPRYCLWLKNVYPAELRSMPHVLERMKLVREMRLASPDKGTQRLADTPHLFRETNNPQTAILVPSHSSENRRYIPLGFIDDSVITTNATLIIPNATLYHFGVLTSNVHMAWMRVVCGRLKSDYRYSKDIVYNNFPWPTPTDEQKARIEQTAQTILDARAKYPDSSLADLYDEVTMPPELRKAHQENDRAVMAAYGFSTKMTESECVAQLFNLYQQLISQ